MRTLLLTPVLFSMLSLPSNTFACMWDYDTLKQERARFPSTLELITGKFLRHSPEFYQWRIQDRLRKLAADPQNLAYHDDLAVAYEKTGQHAKAIETMLAKEKIQPGLYETYSNLGTFHILAGDFELGLPYIDKALAINPDAHFGREKYQKWLVEYAISRRFGNTLTFPLTRGRKPHTPCSDFKSFLATRLHNGQFTHEHAQEAIRGVLGMMRFANHDNPLLLEALGDLLYNDLGSYDAKQLAARCYLKASYLESPQIDSIAFQRSAEAVLQMQTSGPNSTDAISLGTVDAAFRAELKDTESWYETLRASELTWIRDGANVEEEYDKLYASEPEALGGAHEDLIDIAHRHALPIIFGAICLAMLLASGLTLRWLIRRRYRKRSITSPPLERE